MSRDLLLLDANLVWKDGLYLPVLPSIPNPFIADRIFPFPFPVSAVPQEMAQARMEAYRNFGWFGNVHEWEPVKKRQKDFMVLASALEAWKMDTLGTWTWIRWLFPSKSAATLAHLDEGHLAILRSHVPTLHALHYHTHEGLISNGIHDLLPEQYEEERKYRLMLREAASAYFKQNPEPNVLQAIVTWSLLGGMAVLICTSSSGAAFPGHLKGKDISSSPTQSGSPAVSFMNGLENIRSCVLHHFRNLGGVHDVDKSIFLREWSPSMALFLFRMVSHSQQFNGLEKATPDSLKFERADKDSGDQFDQYKPSEAEKESGATAITEPAANYLFGKHTERWSSEWREKIYRESKGYEADLAQMRKEELERLDRLEKITTKYLEYEKLKGVRPMPMPWLDKLEKYLRKEDSTVYVNQVRKGTFDLEATANGMGMEHKLARCSLLKVPLRARLKVKKALLYRTKSTDTGVIPRRMYRYPIDGKVFGRSTRRYGTGGTILIDSSGSMSWDDETILALAQRLPFATVAVYASQRADMDAGRIIIVKQGMRSVSKETYDYIRASLLGGGNVVDVQALHWLSRRTKPRFWISDGHVTGPGDSRNSFVTEFCRVIQEGGDIVQLNGGDVESILKQVNDWRKKHGRR